MTTETLAASIDALLVTVKALQVRVASLEQRRALTFRGVWQRGQTYHEADAVHFAGGIWVAMAGVTTAEPDAGSNAWQLAARAGRDPR